MRTILLIALIFFFHSWIAGQQLQFYKPEKLQNIPASETYNIMQDHTGYIWFSSEAGLCRFNGNTFKVYDHRNGLPEKATYVVTEDMNNRLWIITSENRILNFVNDSLVEAPFSKAYSEKFKNSLLNTYLCVPDGDSLLWLSSQYESHCIDLRTNAIRTIEPIDTICDYNLTYRNGFLINIKSEKIKGSQVDRRMKTQNVVIGIRFGNKIQRIITPQNNLSWRIYSVSSSDGVHYISFENLLIRLDRNRKTEFKLLKNSIIGLYVDKNNGLWVGTVRNGVHYFPHPADFSQRLHMLQEYSVSGICEDHESGIWVSTLERGIFYCRNKHVVNYNNLAGLDKKPEMLKGINGKVFISATQGELIEITEKGLQIHSYDFPEKYFTHDIIQTSSGWIVAGKAFTGRSNHHFKKQALFIAPFDNKGAGSNKITCINDNSYYSVHFGNIIEFDSTKIIARYNLTESPGRSIFYHKKQGLLIGCKDGLFRFDLENKTISKIPGAYGGINKFLETSAGEIWMTTKGKGIFILDDKGISPLSNRIVLPTNIFFDITQDKRGNLWIGSNVGLIRINDSGSIHSDIYNTFHGLPSNEIFNVATGNDSIYFSTPEGLSSFSLLDELRNNSSPGISVDSIHVNGKIFRNLSTLKHDENNIRINFNVTTFKETESELVAYKLDPLDTEWHYLKGRELVLANLPYGKYELLAYGMNHDRLNSKVPVVLNFTILKPVWLQTWFIILSVVFVSCLIWLIVKLVINRIRRKEEEKTYINKLLAEYQLSALRAQMNPHFIFNCINSIQRYILTNESEAAYDYLSKFSKLIRLVLNTSDKNMISLDQELELVELYIKMEQLRAEHKFTFSIEVSDEIELSETEVPTMFLQPYIENSIWHGIMHLDERAGHVKIKIGLKDEFLMVIIEDNGIGRVQSALRRSKNHVSKSSVINKKRVEILNLIYHRDMAGDVVMEDVINTCNEIAGTRVIIKISNNTYNYV